MKAGSTNFNLLPDGHGRARPSPNSTNTAPTPAAPPSPLKSTAPSNTMASEKDKKTNPNSFPNITTNTTTTVTNTTTMGLKGSPKASSSKTSKTSKTSKISKLSTTFQSSSNSFKSLTAPTISTTHPEADIKKKQTDTSVAGILDDDDDVGSVSNTINDSTTVGNSSSSSSTSTTSTTISFLGEASSSSSLKKALTKVQTRATNVMLTRWVRDEMDLRFHAASLPLYSSCRNNVARGSLANQYSNLRNQNRFYTTPQEQMILARKLILQGRFVLELTGVPTVLKQLGTSRHSNSTIVNNTPKGSILVPIPIHEALDGLVSIRSYTFDAEVAGCIPFSENANPTLLASCPSLWSNSMTESTNVNTTASMSSPSSSSSSTPSTPSAPLILPTSLSSTTLMHAPFDGHAVIRSMPEKLTRHLSKSVLTSESVEVVFIADGHDMRFGPPSPTYVNGDPEAPFGSSILSFDLSNIGKNWTKESLQLDLEELCDLGCIFQLPGQGGPIWHCNGAEPSSLLYDEDNGYGPLLTDVREKSIFNIC